ncbi:MAG: hypothetical protein AAF687_10000 [Pseudomonadota bacterium]
MATLFLRLSAIVLLFAIATGGALGEPARADSWSPPETKTYEAANGEYRFTVEPSPIGTSLDYFTEEVKALEEGRELERPTPLGLLERKLPNGEWRAVWGAPLMNRVAPVDALVSRDGRYVVTFDNWHSLGHGENVIVIYGADGALVRSLQLTDLFPETYSDALPHSVSSIRWRRDKGLSGDGASLFVDVVVPGTASIGSEPETVRFTITLADGQVTMPPERAWEAALAASDKITQQRLAEKQKRLAYLTEPLVAPETCEMGEWHDYLWEAHMRLTPFYLDDPSVWKTVLFPPDHPRYGESVGWLEEELTEDFGWDNEVAVASPCAPEGLVAAIEKISAKLAPNSLPKTILYVSAPKADHARIAKLLAPSGIQIRLLDPSTAIPQRPERIPGSPEAAAADEERWRRQSEAMDAMMDALDEVEAPVDVSQ